MGVAQCYVLNEENECKRPAGNVMMLLCAMGEYLHCCALVPSSSICGVYICTNWMMMFTLMCTLNKRQVLREQYYYIFYSLP